MKGIVYKTTTGEVLYKFDTSTYPQLNAGEAIKERDDINSIQQGATYNPVDDTYVNPPAVAPKDYKALFAAAATPDAKLQVIADKLGLI